MPFSNLVLTLTDLFAIFSSLPLSLPFYLLLEPGKTWVGNLQQRAPETLPKPREKHKAGYSRDWVGADPRQNRDTRDLAMTV